MLVYIAGIDLDLRSALVRCLERYSFEQSLHHCVQASRADILGVLIHLEGDLGESPHTTVNKFDFDILGRKKRVVLQRQRGVRFGQDPDEIVRSQRL